MVGWGDSITRDGQYEYHPAFGDHSVLFNGDRMPILKMMALDGLFALPDLRKTDYDRQASDGSTPGQAFFGARILTGDVALISDNQYDMMQSLMDIQEVLQPEDEDGVLVFRRPRVGKRLIFCRADRVAFQSNADLAMGTARGAVQFTAHDPRIYSIYEDVTTITLAPGVTSGSGNVYMGGNWKRGVPAKVEINGPGTNVRVANNDHDNRQFKLEGVVSSGQAITLDTGRLTVTDENTGASATGLLSRDSQWWQLQKGDNVIAVNRDSPGTGTLVVKVYSRDGFTL